MSSSTTMPVITAIFKKCDSAAAIVFDEEAGNGLRSYIDRSCAVEETIKVTLKKIVAADRPIVVWGAGTHTQHLLESTDLAKIHITAFVDSNPSYQNKELNGTRILSPEILAQMSEPILVSSRVFQDEIVTKIRDEMHLKNMVITLYDSAEVR